MQKSIFGRNKDKLHTRQLTVVSLSVVILKNIFFSEHATHPFVDRAQEPVTVSLSDLFKMLRIL